MKSNINSKIPSKYLESNSNQLQPSHHFKTKSNLNQTNKITNKRVFLITITMHIYSYTLFYVPENKGFKNKEKTYNSVWKILIIFWDILFLFYDLFLGVYSPYFWLLQWTKFNFRV